MQTVSTIGHDIAKSVFQVHGVDADGLMVRGGGKATITLSGNAEGFVLSAGVAIVAGFAVAPGSDDR